MSFQLIFCGVGALGSTTALFCRNLNAHLSFIDFDRVESKNLSAQAFVKQSLGKNKAQALKVQLFNFYGLKSEAFAVRLVKQNIQTLLSKADLLVDCFDNAQSRQLLMDYAQRQSIPLVHGAISAAGDFGLVRWCDHFSIDKEDKPGQATCEGGEHLPMIGLISTALAQAIQVFINETRQVNYMVNSQGIQKLQLV